MVSKPIPQQPEDLSPGINSSYNRGEQISRKDDSFKDISIGLQDIDEALLYYFNEVIKPSVKQSDNLIKVPVLIGSPERWQSVQKNGFYRDKDAKLLCPLIMFKRETIEKNRSITTKLDGNKINHYQIVEQKYSKRNQYDRFSVLNNRIPQVELHATQIPDYLTLTYSCIIWTNYVEQNNKIIEAIEFASDSYWGNNQKYSFRASVTNFSTTILIEQDSDRAAKTSFTLVLNGYIIPDSINKFMATDVDKFYSKCNISVNESFLD